MQNGVNEMFQKAEAFYSGNFHRTQTQVFVCFGCALTGVTSEVLERHQPMIEPTDVTVIV